MRSKAPTLMPIFRSRHQAEVLTWLFLHPGEEFTVTDLAQRLGVPMTTIHTETQRLLEAELLSARSVGRSRLLSANADSRVAEPLTRLLEVTFGPQVVVAEEFADVVGVELVLIFGSWAARYGGVGGPPPNDVDVLVVGRPDREMVYAAADRAQERLGMEVNPVVRSGEKWRTGDDPLVTEVKASPMVLVRDEAASVA